MQQKIRNKFQELFSTKGSVYASPGRINLIGEHTDYNGGFVFPGAIDKGMIAEIKPNGTGKVRAFSVDLNDYAEFGLNEEDAPKASWARYIFGVSFTNAGFHFPCGTRWGLITSDISDILRFFVSIQPFYVIDGFTFHQYFDIHFK